MTAQQRLASREFFGVKLGLDAMCALVEGLDHPERAFLPVIVAGGAAGGMKGGRHIRYDKPTPMANLHLTLLDKAGVRMDSFADSTGKVDGLFEPLSI